MESSRKVENWSPHPRGSPFGQSRPSISPVGVSSTCEWHVSQAGLQIEKKNLPQGVKNSVAQVDRNRRRRQSLGKSMVILNLISTRMKEQRAGESREEGLECVFVEEESEGLCMRSNRIVLNKGKESA